MEMDALIEAAFQCQSEGRLAEAELLYRAGIERSPGHVTACVNLARLLIRQGAFEDAIRWLRWATAEAPDLPDVYSQLGLAYARLQRLEAALEAFDKVLASSPDDIGTLQIVANLQQALGRPDEARRTFLRCHALQPLMHIAAASTPPEFRALLLFAPGAGNTPIDFLITDAPFESRILNLLPDVPYDVAHLKDGCDVVVNLVADVDLGQAAIAQAESLVDAIGLPVINAPRLIAETDREAIAHRLEGTSGCIVPRTQRYAATELLSRSHAFPLLVRPAGTHGGKDFFKVGDPQRLHALLGNSGDPYYYVTEYVDYRSADGFFRKYRFLFVDDEVLPYHLAIGDQWKVHHATTGMADHAWMQDEERAFLADPRHVFNDAQFATLNAIRNTIGLDYFGIDCGVDRAGRIVVFEVNACMLVHDHNDTFPYKADAVGRIRQAFHAMLQRRRKTGPTS